MSLKRIYAVFVRQLFLIRGNPTRLGGIFIWIVVDIVQWGFISKYIGSLGQATFSFITVILGAIILWEFMSRIQQGIMMSFLEDVWTPNFINFFSSPLRIGEYLAGLVLSSIVTSFMVFCLMAILAGLAFGYNIFRIGLLILPFMMILFIFGMAMGIFVAACIFRLGPSAEWFGWPIPLLMSIFTGVFYPISTLPLSLRWIAKLIPSSYVFESLRALVNNGNFSSQLAMNLIIGFVLALVYLAVMYFFFSFIYHKNLKDGKIANLNAEDF